MPDDRAPAPDPSPEELEEILQNLEFFLAMEEAEILPLEEEDDDEEPDDGE